MAEHYIAPVPSENAVVRAPRKQGDELAYRYTEVYRDYYDRRTDTLNLKPTVVFGKKYEDQTASIATTDISDGSLTAGLYRLAVYQQVNRAASVSSSLTVAVSWTNRSAAQTVTFAAMNGNTTATNQRDDLPLFHLDANSPVNVTITYASAGATTMRYDCYITLERIPA